MILADHFVETLGPELVGERMRRVLVEACGADRARAARLGARGHPPTTAEIFCPPRRIMMRLLRLGTPLSRSRSRVFAMRSPLTSWITSPRWKPRLLA